MKTKFLGEGAKLAQTVGSNLLKLGQEVIDKKVDEQETLKSFELKPSRLSTADSRILAMENRIMKAMREQINAAGVQMIEELEQLSAPRLSGEKEKQKRPSLKKTLQIEYRSGQPRVAVVYEGEVRDPNSSKPTRIRAIIRAETNGTPLSVAIERHRPGRSEQADEYCLVKFGEKPVMKTTGVSRDTESRLATSQLTEECGYVTDGTTHDATGCPVRITQTDFLPDAKGKPTHEVLCVSAEYEKDPKSTNVVSATEIKVTGGTAEDDVTLDEYAEVQDGRTFRRTLQTFLVQLARLTCIARLKAPKETVVYRQEMRDSSAFVYEPGPNSGIVEGSEPIMRDFHHLVLPNKFNAWQGGSIPVKQVTQSGNLEVITTMPMDKMMYRFLDDGLPTRPLTLI